MVNRKRLAVVVLLILAMLLTGCLPTLDSFYRGETVPFEEMEYTRPDVQQLETVLQQSCRIAGEGKDLDAVMEGIYAFYDVYDAFYTGYTLANLHYCHDVTDIYWSKEYTFCNENIYAADAALDTLYRALAASPVREALEGEDYFGPGYFDAYEGESLWDDTFMDLMDRETQLENRYYELSSQAMETEYGSEAYFTRYGTEMEGIFLELVALRQEIAAYAGYDSYPEFAYTYYHVRDYTPRDMEAYLTAVGEGMSRMYRDLSGSTVWNAGAVPCSELQTFQYVKHTASQMGGVAAEAFRMLEEGGLYDIGYGPNKFDGIFETYIWQYNQPFIFMAPTQRTMDQLYFAHEFGHFVSDYVIYGSTAGTDVCEVQSQAMEYLSLEYGEASEALADCKLADALCTYVEQAAYSLFELQVYGLEEEALTAEGIRTLYGQICQDFGLDSWGGDSRDYVTVTHLFAEPMYMASYVVAGDVALQICQLEKAEPGRGLEVYDACIRSNDSYLIAFVQSLGLESPFAPGRLEKVQALFREELKEYL